MSRTFAIAWKHAVLRTQTSSRRRNADEETFLTASSRGGNGPPGYGTSTFQRVDDNRPYPRFVPSGNARRIRSAIAFNTKGIVAQKLLKSIKRMSAEYRR